MGEQSQRFTLDGGAALEARLQGICDQVVEQVRQAIPVSKLEGIVLAGGYGRGEGGVLRTPNGELPYNDVEFYVFAAGNRFVNERKYAGPLLRVSESLSAEHGLHIEFKLDSLTRLRGSPISMFSYDLVSRHRVVHGEPGLFAGCGHHLRAGQLPAAEGSRLLLNRFTGLLLVKELLAAEQFSVADADFSRRNLAKAQLALGDALLTHLGRYHWSCLERKRRLEIVTGQFPQLTEIRSQYAVGIEFKLHPFRSCESRAELAAAHRSICVLGQKLWLWLEGRRLQRGFSTPREYALCPLQKWPANSRWRNCLLTLRSFGTSALLRRSAVRYPRERLFNALPLLLWDNEPELDTLRYLQRQLHTVAANWAGLVGAYKKVWSSYG